jgi:hypothetical protein
MKPITINVSEPVYRLFAAEAKKRDRKTSELIRDAMELYLAEKVRPSRALDSWAPVSLGSVKADWADGFFREELLDGRYPR